MNEEMNSQFETEVAVTAALEDTESTVEESSSPSKKARFQEEAMKRMFSVCQQLHLLAKIANKRNVEYTPEYIDKMFAYLEKEMAECKDEFMKRLNGSAGNKKQFDFEF